MEAWREKEISKRSHVLVRSKPERDESQRPLVPGQRAPRNHKTIATKMRPEPLCDLSVLQKEKTNEKASWKCKETNSCLLLSHRYKCHSLLWIALTLSSLGLLDLNQGPPYPLDCVQTDYLPLHGTLTGNLNILRRGSFKPTSPAFHPHLPPSCCVFRKC